jgi:hypothetical protein
MRIYKRCWFVLAICLFCWPVLAAPLAVGGAIPKIDAKDQNGAAYVFTNGTAFLFIATEMASAKAANQKLTALGAGYLEKHHAAYLMDIHTMPAIARFFALPKLRKYPQRIVLIETAGSMDWVPVKADHVTVLALTPDGHIQKIIYWDAAAEPVSGLFSEQ